MVVTGLIIAGYVLATRGVLGLRGEAVRFGSLAAMSLATFWILSVRSTNLKVGTAGVALYVAMVGLHYVLMRSTAERPAWSMLGFASPIVALIGVKYLGFLWDPIWSLSSLSREMPLWMVFLGISYVALRLSHLVIEVRNGAVPRPGLLRYLSFTFFIPTLPIGPISTYRSFHDSVEGVPPDPQVARSLLRILIGATKFLFLGNILNQLSYSGLMLDGHPHPPLDLAVAAVCFYLYLYCNFSGACDMIVGASLLAGIRVEENFHNPFIARSVQEFWTRWHITLGAYMRDVVFTPVSKLLAGWFGPRNVSHAIAVAFLVVFVLLGVWHGVGWNFFWLGVMHAIAVAVNHYYDRWLKRRLGKRHKAYMRNPWIRAVAMAATFTYVAATLFLFANDFAHMEMILEHIQ